MAYQGKFEHVIDAKNRLFIPAIFREALGERFVAVKGPDGCIALYDESTWTEHILPQISELSGTHEGRQKQRMLYSSALSLEADKQGRITISKELTAYAGLQSEVVILGAASRIEIWSKESWTLLMEHETGMPDILW